MGKFLLPNNYTIFIGALLVYDITDTDSFKKMTDWVKELR